MPILRLAYATQFLLALIAVFVLWSEVGGQGHLDIMPWYLKLVLGGGAAFATVKATAAAVSNERSWNGQTLRWIGVLLLLLLGCGLVTYYYHLYGEEDEEDEDQSVTSSLALPDSSAEFYLPRVTLILNARTGLTCIRSICDSRFRLGAGRTPAGRPYGGRTADAGRGGAG